jgi:DNA-binding PadR family transcriptional regulator
MADNDLYQLALDTAQAFDPIYRTAMQQAIDEVGMEGPDWGLLFTALGYEPRPLSLARLCEVAPYTAAERLAGRLAGTASRGFLAPAGDGAYRITERGRQALMRTFTAVHSVLATFEPLPEGDMRRLAGLLRRVVEAATAAPEPRDKCYFSASRLTDPGADAPPVTQIDQYLTDLARWFRDDVHPAAWRPYEVSGPAWEALTLVWRGEADTPDALAQRLERRGHTAAIYADALHDLSARGWVAEQAGVYRITAEGQAVRQAAEDQTDRLFYAPWSCLSGAEAHELRSLMTRLRDALQQLGAENTS